MAELRADVGLDPQRVLLPRRVDQGGVGQVWRVDPGGVVRDAWVGDVRSDLRVVPPAPTRAG